MQRETSRVLAGRYELGPVLGEGGMARVHRGLDRQLRRSVAVKVLAAPFDRDRAFVERFRREARAAAGLSHPNIVAVFDSGSDDATHFIVTELVEGETLAARIRREGALPVDEAVAIAVDVSRALAAAHERGLIHRDIKPGNVMLLPDGRVKVVDFGIARAAGSDTLTGTGVVLGSTAYVSPEQASGGPVDGRSDIYALGCVLYEVLSGHVPFRADTPVATMYRHVNEEPPPLSTPRVPAELEAIVMRCLAKEPRRRFGSAQELEAALLQLPVAGDTQRLEPVAAAATQPVPAIVSVDAETQPVPAVAPVPRYRRVPRAAYAVAGVVLLVGVAALALNAVSDPLRPRAEARATSGDPAETALPTQAPPTFATAWSHLVEAIGSAQALGEIDDHAAEELGKRAVELLDAYREGDPDKLRDALGDLEEELAKAIEKGEISPSAADAIDQAIFEIGLALESEGALVVPSPTEEVDDESSGEGGGEGGNSGEGGPPPHANNDKDDD